MSYTPTQWNTGDTITASALNKIENGIANAGGGGGAMIVTSSLVNGVTIMDKTVQEIYDALMSGTPVYYKFQYGAIGADYITHAWLAPITYVYTYDFTNTIRVAVNRPSMGSASATGSTGDYLIVPSSVVFQATGMNDYPTYYRTVYATPASSESASIFY